MKLRQEHHTIEVPDDGDPRWPALLARMMKVHTKFAPLPEGSVLDMECAFICREIHRDAADNVTGYTETIYMVHSKDMSRLMSTASGADWRKVEDWALLNPGFSTLQIIEKVERKEIPL